MESRPSIHYPGNTVVDVPKPGRKRLALTLDNPKPLDFEGSVMQPVDKVCAVSVCVWCGYAADHYFITCASCKNCQYCGYIDAVDPYRCFICGNHLPVEAQTELVKYNADSENPQVYN